MYGMWLLKLYQNIPQTLMHIIRRFVKSSYSMHKCLRCVWGHLQWSQSLHITLANPRLAVIELHTRLQLHSLPGSRDNWSWQKHFWPRLNQFNPNWANPPIGFHTDRQTNWPYSIKSLTVFNTHWLCEEQHYDWYWYFETKINSQYIEGVKTTVAKTL